MAKAHKISNAGASAELDALTALMDGGLLRIYDATGGVPANVDDALPTQVLLAELTLGNPAFGAAVNGVATANAITKEASAPAGGTAAFYRGCKADGTAVDQGTVGVADQPAPGDTYDLELNSVAIGIGVEVTVSSWQLTQNKA